MCSSEQVTPILRTMKTPAESAAAAGEPTTATPARADSRRTHVRWSCPWCHTGTIRRLCESKRNRRTIDIANPAAPRLSSNDAFCRSSSTRCEPRVKVTFAVHGIELHPEPRPVLSNSASDTVTKCFPQFQVFGVTLLKLGSSARAFASSGVTCAVASSSSSSSPVCAVRVNCKCIGLRFFFLDELLVKPHQLADGIARKRRFVDPRPIRDDQRKLGSQSPDGCPQSRDIRRKKHAPRAHRR